MRYRISRTRVSLALVLVCCLGFGISNLYSVPAWTHEWDNDTSVMGTYAYDGTNALNINGDVVIDGDVYITNTLGGGNYFPVTITQDSFLHPEWEVEGTNYAHLIFYADRCSGIMVYVDYDLIFTGSNWGDKDVKNLGLTLTFSGQGQTVFHLASKKQVGFEGFFGDGTGPTAGWNGYWDDYTKTGSGVSAFIVMDQTFDDAVGQGMNKVVFERFYSFDENDPVNTSTHESVKITVGKNSFITYISDCDTGVFEECGASEIGFGTLAFDPSCYGPGRMLLHVKGSNYVNTSGELVGLTNAYNDGALVVAGHYVSDYTDPDVIRTQVKLNQPAGVDAIFRIIDEQAVRDSVAGPYYWTGSMTFTNDHGEPVFSGDVADLNANSGKPSRRGLLVLNENKSIPTFAADPYVNNHWYNEYVFKAIGAGASSIRPGFILGQNGSMELFHNTFMDYVAASTMRTNPFEIDRFGQTLSTTVMKKHNPSAFIVDGLEVQHVTNFDPADPYGNLLYPDYVSDVASYGGRHAQILLRGDARLYLRSGVRKDGFIDVSVSGTIEGPGAMGGYTIGLDRLYSFTINYDSTEGAYDGSVITGLSIPGGLWYETAGEGCNALDVEGKLSIRSTQDHNTNNDAGFIIYRTNDRVSLDTTLQLQANCFARHDITDLGPRGVLNVPPLKLDYMGQEVRDDMLNRVMRPLTVNRVYPAYNSSSIFLNAEMALHNINWHHNDVLKIATPEQDKAECQVVGGEKAAYDFAYWSTVASGTGDTLYVENPVENINTKVPLISMFDSTLHLHESIVASGVRFVVTDKFWYDPDDDDGHPKLVPNTSIFRCYNHGDQLDMLKRGYGRTILLGSQQNKLADGIILTEYTQNAYLNVYRGWNTAANSGTWGGLDDRIRLSLETDAQPKYTIQYETRTSDPTSFSKLVEEGLSNYKRVATQVFYLGNNSFSSLGWTTTYGDQVISVADMNDRDFGTNYSYSWGINEGARPRPWDAAWGVSDRYDVSDTGGTTPIKPYEFRYSLTTEENAAAELYINGDCYYFGGRDVTGNIATEPVVASNEACIFYTNHGGKTHINQQTLSVDQGHYYDAFVDTIFAYRQWPRIWSDTSAAYIDGLSGIVDLPHDQVKFARSIQPYHLDFPNMYLADEQTKERNVRLSVYDEQNPDYGYPAKREKASGEEVTIAWNFRTDKSVRIGYGEAPESTMETSPTYTPVKALPAFMSEGILTAAADIIDARTTKQAELVMTATMPEVLLTVSTGDVITQMRVSGATKADPLHLYITGGHQGYGIVREFTSLAANYFNPGEGCHAAIFLDGGGHCGLGSREWNGHSSNAWSVLGHDYVTLYPNGNGFVWVNSDLIIADRLPIIPTTNFGSYNNDAQVLTHATEDQRLTFFSPIPVEIRVPEGGELDLSAFGNPGGTISSDFPQQIEFAGKVRLVIEAGASIRFPGSVRQNPESFMGQVEPVLYFNDESELIFEGAEDRDAALPTTWPELDKCRSKILGIGQIWLNKKAKLKVNDTARVGVETDDQTVTTSVTISIQRQSEMQIGNEDVAGGSFQVGNPENRGGNIEFKLAVRRAQSRILLHREGFLGFGVGTISKLGDINEQWKLLGLYNVDRIQLAFESEGVFDHSQIFDGYNSRASLMAIGPATTYEVILGPDNTKSVVRGGGNLIRIVNPGDTWPATLGSEVIGSTATIAGGATGDYTLLSSTPIIRQLTSVANGTGTVVKSTSFTGNAQGFYNYMGYLPLGTMPEGSYVCFGITEELLRIGYITGTTILRRDDFTISDGSDPAGSAHLGALSCSIDPSGVPTAFNRSY